MNINNQYTGEDVISVQQSKASIYKEAHPGLGDFWTKWYATM